MVCHTDAEAHQRLVGVSSCCDVKIGSPAYLVLSLAMAEVADLDRMSNNKKGMRMGRSLWDAPNISISGRWVIARFLLHLYST